MTRPPSRPAPCIPGDPIGASCLAGILLGVRCCPDGRCALCQRDHARRRRLGFDEATVIRDAALQRRRQRTRCPACGFPPPPPLREIPPLPRLDRTQQPLAGSSTCLHCRAFLPNPRRRYCNDSCWNAYLTESRRSERSESRSHRVARV